MMCLYRIKNNIIECESIKDRTEKSIIETYTTLWKIISATGVVMLNHIFDNKANETFMKENKKDVNSNFILSTHMS